MHQTASCTQPTAHTGRGCQLTSYSRMLCRHNKDSGEQLIQRDNEVAATSIIHGYNISVTLSDTWEGHEKQVALLSSCNNRISRRGSLLTYFVLLNDDC